MAPVIGSLIVTGAESTKIPAKRLLKNEECTLDLMEQPCHPDSNSALVADITLEPKPGAL
jgi:hypothetical protein